MAWEQNTKKSTKHINVKCDKGEIILARGKIVKH